MYCNLASYFSIDKNKYYFIDEGEMNKSLIGIKEKIDSATGQELNGKKSIKTPQKLQTMLPKIFDVLIIIFTILDFLFFQYRIFGKSKNYIILQIYILEIVLTILLTLRGLVMLFLQLKLDLFIKSKFPVKKQFFFCIWVLIFLFYIYALIYQKCSLIQIYS